MFLMIFNYVGGIPKYKVIESLILTSFSNMDPPSSSFLNHIHPFSRENLRNQCKKKKKRFFVIEEIKISSSHQVWTRKPLRWDYLSLYHDCGGRDDIKPAHGLSNKPHSSYVTEYFRQAYKLEDSKNRKQNPTSIILM